jgi:chromate transporter
MTATPEKNSRLESLKTIFGVFLRLGTMMFGGGYTMLPLLEHEIVRRRKWATHEEMLDYYAMAQSVPGVIAVNTAMMIGFRLRGWRGGIMATLGMITAPIIVILQLAMFLGQLELQAHGARIFQALRITVAAVLLATAIKLMLRACTGWKGWLYAAIAVLLQVVFRVNVAWIILTAVAAGIIIHLAACRRMKGPAS